MLIDEISKSIINDDSDLNRKRWAQFIIDKKIDLSNIIDLHNCEKRIATRFIWIVGDICEINPKIVFPLIKYFFSIRNSTPITNYNRSLAKMFYLSGIPIEIEGEATTELFNWVLNPKTIVSTKYYAILALSNLATKYPELKNELKLVVEDQIPKNSISFKKVAIKVLSKIS